MPLHSAGKLGAVLFQFPQWFVISKASKAYIEEVVDRLPDYRVAVEFRHKSWMEERNVEETLGFLSRAEPAATWRSTCRRDSTRASRRSRPPPPTTSRWSGSTAATSTAWNVKSDTASERFRYDYPTDELQEWVPEDRARWPSRRARPTS